MQCKADLNALREERTGKQQESEKYTEMKFTEMLEAISRVDKSFKEALGKQAAVDVVDETRSMLIKDHEARIMLEKAYLARTSELEHARATKIELIFALSQEIDRLRHEFVVKQSLDGDHSQCSKVGCAIA
jgi:hypothetical protein